MHALALPTPALRHTDAVPLTRRVTTAPPPLPAPASPPRTTTLPLVRVLARTLRAAPPAHPASISPVCSRPSRRPHPRPAPGRNGQSRPFSTLPPAVCPHPPSHRRAHPPARHTEAVAFPAALPAPAAMSVLSRLDLAATPSPHTHLRFVSPPPSRPLGLRNYTAARTRHCPRTRIPPPSCTSCCPCPHITCRSRARRPSPLWCPRSTFPCPSVTRMVSAAVLYHLVLSLITTAAVDRISFFFASSLNAAPWPTL